MNRRFAAFALVITAMAAPEDRLLRGAWISLEVIGWYVIIPLALSALFTGVGIALSKPSGLFRHYWVLTSLFLTYRI